jgi:hypothetical protein
MMHTVATTMYGTTTKYSFTAGGRRKPIEGTKIFATVLLLSNKSIGHGATSSVSSKGRSTPQVCSVFNWREWLKVCMMITFLCGLLALIIAILHGMGKGNRPPLWIAVALLGIGVMVPWLVSMSFR